MKRLLHCTANTCLKAVNLFTQYIVESRHVFEDDLQSPLVRSRQMPLRSMHLIDTSSNSTNYWAAGMYYFCLTETSYSLPEVANKTWSTPTLLRLCGFIDMANFQIHIKMYRFLQLGLCIAITVLKKVVFPYCFPGVEIIWRMILRSCSHNPCCMVPQHYLFTELLKVLNFTWQMQIIISNVPLSCKWAMHKRQWCIK